MWIALSDRYGRTAQNLALAIANVNIILRGRISLMSFRYPTLTQSMWSLGCLNSSKRTVVWIARKSLQICRTKSKAHYTRSDLEICHHLQSTILFCASNSSYRCWIWNITARYAARSLVTNANLYQNSIQSLISTVFDLGIHALRQEVPIVLPDDALLAGSIQGVLKLFPRRDQALETLARTKLSIRFNQLHDAIQSSVSH